MSRSNVAPGRNLSLTEELERLEQSITLTLQEIDHSFSKAHRIVTTSILPIVDQYAHHSQEVWEGSKFWKHFFEASANVSLSGYEEPPADEDHTYTTASAQDSTFETPPTRTLEHDDDAQFAEDGVGSGEEESSMIMDSPSNATGVHSTPRVLGSASRSRSPPPSKQKMAGLPMRSRQESEEPSTPRPQATRETNFQFSSPFDPPSAFQPPTAQRQNHDPLLHRVLDKTYRIQATPHTGRKAKAKAAAKPDTTPHTATARTLTFDDSPQSSPAIAPPQLRSDLFSPAPYSAKKAPRLPRTPGAPLQSPAPRLTSTGKPVMRQPTNPQVLAQRTPALWDSDDESDTEGFDMSPPKTMQFAIPGSRLMPTPAREASRRIVEDLLTEAGLDGEGTEDLELPSPTVVRGIEEDDTF